MATKNYTTKTASLRATKIDTNKIELKGKNILDYISENKTTILDDRGTNVTEDDLWGTTITTDENGVVHVSHKFLSNPNGDSPWNSEVKSINDNKAYTSTDASGEPLCNIQTEMIKDGSYMFKDTLLTSFSGDLSNLINGDFMFNGCTFLTSFDNDLSNLTTGNSMFYDTNLTSFFSTLSSLISGTYMFQYTPLTLFLGTLSSLTNGSAMFQGTSLTLFGVDLSSLTNGSDMFKQTPLTSFSSDLSSLTNGSAMFYSTNLTSFSGDLSNLTNGSDMFANTSLTSFSEDLSRLVNGDYMFSNTHKRGYTISHYKMVDGVKTQVTEHFRAEGLTSFSGDLSSLQSGYEMFGTGGNITYTNEEGVTETTKNITPLDEQSIMIIADTIKDLNGFTDWDSSVDEMNRGFISLGYDSTVCDAAKIEEYCKEIMNKGWIVYLNGTLQTTDEGIEGVATADEDGTITVSPVPYYCKPVEVD